MLVRSLARLASWTVLGSAVLAVGCSAGPNEDASSSADAIRIDQLPIKVTQHNAGIFQQDIDHPREGGAIVGRFEQRYWYSTERTCRP